MHKKAALNLIKQRKDRRKTMKKSCANRKIQNGGNFLDKI
jgi:hypothetical protein